MSRMKSWFALSCAFLILGQAAYAVDPTSEPLVVTVFDDYPLIKPTKFDEFFGAKADDYLRVELAHL